MDNIEGLQNTVRYTVQDKVSYQVRVICFYRCKHDGLSGDIDGFSHGYNTLQYEKQLEEAINDAYRKLFCSPVEFYPKLVSVIEYRPQAPYLDVAFKQNLTYLQVREIHGKTITKTQLDIMHKLIDNRPLTKNQIAKAYRIEKTYGKALKRIAEDTGNKKDYDSSVKQLEKERIKAAKEKKE